VKGKVWQEIKSLSQIELEAKLRDNEEELFRMKFRHASTPIKNPLKIRTAKRMIAKIKTLLNDKNKQEKK
jgi:large subunit ribosomal protein L29